MRLVNKKINQVTGNSEIMGYLWYESVCYTWTYVKINYLKVEVESIKIEHSKNQFFFLIFEVVFGS